MCLIYKSRNSPHSEPFTAYKVYDRAKINHARIPVILLSPWCGNTPGGLIGASGTYTADLLPNVKCQIRHPINVANFLGWDEDWQDVVDKEIDISGFHAFLDSEAAESYLKYLKQCTWPRATGDIVVVQVRIDPADVLAIGETCITFIHNDPPIVPPKYDQLSLSTVVSKKITITPDEFERVSKCA